MGLAKKVAAKSTENMIYTTYRFRIRPDSRFKLLLLLLLLLLSLLLLLVVVVEVGE